MVGKNARAGGGAGRRIVQENSTEQACREDEVEDSVSG
jgi:hypothetical protein